MKNIIHSKSAWLNKVMVSHVWGMDIMGDLSDDVSMDEIHTL